MPRKFSTPGAPAANLVQAALMVIWGVLATLASPLTAIIWSGVFLLATPLMLPQRKHLRDPTTTAVQLRQNEL